jgi:hypothetical protein
MALWAQYMLPGDQRSVTIWPYPMSRRGQFVSAALTVVAALLFVAFAGYAASRYFHLSGWDDYRAGFSAGAAWRAEGGHGSCFNHMTARYGDVSWPDRAPGWGEFLSGCQDGRLGRESASWYNFASRFEHNS